jgi:protein kinase-like protein
MAVVTLKRWHEISRACETALTRPVSERGSFIREVCAGDLPLQRDLESLLTQTRAFEQSSSRRHADDIHDLPPGTRIGPYVLLDVLGVGGMGEVFLGTDTRLHRKVALKRLFSSAAAGEDARAAVMREARAAARITHPNIAAVYDVLEHDGRAFIVMEYVEGESLARRLARERLPIDRVVTIGRQLAAALMAAHAKSVIHSDLKPGNIHFAPDGSVKILDFGIAQASTMATTSTNTTMTTAQSEVTPVIGGTPAYMSPEQMMGHGLDYRSDIFSLGVVLYEMATGHRPYKTNDPFELVVQLTRRPPRADRDDPRVPRSLADVIEKALEIDLSARYQRAAEIEVALAALQPAWRWPLWSLLCAGIGVLFVVLTFLGFVTSRALEIGFEREGAFRVDSPLSWPMWGLKSMIAPVVFSATTLVVIALLRTICRLVIGIPPVKRLIGPALERGDRAVKMMLRLPSVRSGELLFLVQVVSLAMFAWYFWPLIMSMSTFQSRAEGWIGELRPSNLATHEWAGELLTVGLLAFGVAWYRLSRLTAPRGQNESMTTLVAGITALALCVFFLSVQYRVLYQNRSERVLYGSEVCYLVGSDGDDALLFCPLRFPRSMTVKMNAITRTGIIENVFSALDWK